VNIIVWLLLGRQIVDETDLKIIGILSKDCRESFMSIGSAVGMTSKSVKARVDTMLSTGVIEEFVVKVNPVALGYGMNCMLIVREHTEHTEDILNRLNLLGDVSTHTKCLGGISAFCLAIKEGYEDKLKLLFNSLKAATVHVMFTSKLSLSSSSTSDLRSKHELSETDLRIIKCLLSNPRMDLNDIGRRTSTSAKTVHRRLTRMRDNNVLRFFILCNPAYTLGYIQFVLIVNTVDKSFYNQIVERIYEELGENVLCQPPVIDPDNVITVILFSQDIFTANGILKKVESFNGVKRVELFIITETTNYHQWVLREIDRRLIAKSTRAKQEVEPVYEVMSVGSA
jgi:DNA-binding Lrp family transcriptional regulator